MPATPPIHIRSFGVLKDNRETSLYTLKNNNGVSVSISNYGATLVSYICPDRQGQLDDIVLGFDNVSGYENSDAYIGATVGRFANRIGHASFSLNNKTYSLDANAAPHHIHGGVSGFSSRIWHADVLDREEPTLRLSLFSPDGDQGYPGNMTVHLLYSLNEANQLHIQIDASSDSDTPISMTNHSYFNLAGSGPINDHWLTLKSNRYTPLDLTQLPSGKFASVEGTPFDFRNARQIGEHIDERHEQLRLGSGYDHNFMTPASEDGELALMATLEDRNLGRKLQLSTNAPGMQLYTANFLAAVAGKGIKHQARHAICLEPQNIPDAPNKPSFPSCILKAGDKYRHTIVFETSTD